MPVSQTRRPRTIVALAGVLLACWVLFTTTVAQIASVAQESPAPASPSPTELPQIADEPRTVDPATLMPPKLAVAATATFADSSLHEIVVWLQTNQHLAVLVEENALAEAGILLGEPVSERLDNAPIYLLLNRLRALGVAWYYEDDILRITSVASQDSRLATMPYNIGDLLDMDYKLDALEDVISGAIAPDSWEDVGGQGVLSFLGDVMFVRHTDEVQRQVQGLLAALRKHARQTFVLDPPQHLVLRQKLGENVSVEFTDMPLELAVQDLGRQAGIDIRLDLPALRTARIREREPITLRLKDTKLQTVLQAMMVDLKLTWILRDGVLWVTSSEVAESLFKTAVYDVRDLCRDDDESAALSAALTSQTEANWQDRGGEGAIMFARPGTLVVYNLERVQMEVLGLLETYRAALRSSRPRAREVADPNEVITVYYRMHANVAEDLATALLRLVRPDTWKTEARPDAPGDILRVASAPDLSSYSRPAKGVSPGVGAPQGPTDAPALVVSRAVLIIRQTRAAHDEIATVIRRVETGDLFGGGAGGPGGMGGGMGGFGGGFF